MEEAREEIQTKSIAAWTRNVEWGEVGEPLEKVKKERVCWVTNCEREVETETVGDGEELLRDEGERIQVTVVVVTIVVDEEFEDEFPTLIW